MEYREYRPSLALAGRVQCFWSFEHRGSLTRRAVVPDGCVDLVYRAHSGRLDWVGAMRHALWLESREPGVAIGVRFKPGGATGLLGERAETLTDRVVLASAVDARRWRPLQSRLDDAATVCERIEILQGRLETLALGNTLGWPTVDPRIAVATERLRDVSHDSIAEIAQSLALSRQHLRRLFLDEVGLTPKHFARSVRVERVASSLRRADNLARLATSLGYTDQSHLSREFATVVGVPPARYRSLQG